MVCLSGRARRQILRVASSWWPVSRGWGWSGGLVGRQSASTYLPMYWIYCHNTEENMQCTIVNGLSSKNTHISMPARMQCPYFLWTNGKPSYHFFLVSFHWQLICNRSSPVAPVYSYTNMDQVDRFLHCRMYMVVEKPIVPVVQLITVGPLAE